MYDTLAINSLEWCDYNAHRNYPLEDSVSAISVSGNTSLPTSLIVDLTIDILDTSLDISKAFFIHSVDVGGDDIVISIGYQPTNSITPIVCARTSAIPKNIAFGIPIDERTFELYCTPQGAALGLTGRLIVGETAIPALTASMCFDRNATRIMPTCIHKLQPAISSVEVQEADGTSIATLTSDFTIRAGHGISLTVVEGDDNVVVINRTEDTTTGVIDVDTILQTVSDSIGTPIKFINAVSPDEDGNIVINGSDCAAIQVTPGGLTISNTCSIPCCNSANVQEVTDAIERFQDARERLTAFYEALTTNINAMQARLSSLIAASRAAGDGSSTSDT